MSQKSRLVYTTDGCNICDECKKPFRKCKCSILKPKERNNQPNLSIYFDKKGRKGAGMTVISGLTLGRDELRNLATDLKKYCGVGGSVKDNNRIELQGDKRQQTRIYLERQAKLVF